MGRSRGFTEGSVLGVDAHVEHAKCLDGEPLEQSADDLPIPDEWSTSERPTLPQACVKLPTWNSRDVYRAEDYDPRKMDFIVALPEQQVKDEVARLLEQQACALAAMIRTREKKEPANSNLLQGYKQCLANIQEAAVKARAAANSMEERLQGCVPSHASTTNLERSTSTPTHICLPSSASASVAAMRV